LLEIVGFMYKPEIGSNIGRRIGPLVELGDGEDPRTLAQAVLKSTMPAPKRNAGPIEYPAAHVASWYGRVNAGAR
jgi:hypothetical protein